MTATIRSSKPSHRRPRRTALRPALFRQRPRLEWMEDRMLLSTFVVSNTADSGPGSLRQAILDLDAAAGATNEIDFDIPASVLPIIDPDSPLPAIANPVLIDGGTQPGFAGTPLVEIDGQLAGGRDGLFITASDVTVRGLDIGGFSSGAAVHITRTAATGDWIYGDFLGTDPTGTQAIPNDYGVEIDAGATDNLVGTNGDGINDAAERNLLSGNLFAGVWINGTGTNANVVAGNLIGTDFSGTVALDNGTQPISDIQGDIFGGGVAISDGASDNRIGTDGQSVDDVGERNIIAGSGNDAIDIYGADTDGNVVAGNFIGTDVTGTHALGVGGDGVFIAEGPSNNWIGVNPIGGPSVGDEANVISGNGADGVQITNGSSGNTVAGNRIGTDVTDAVALGNGGSGVEVDYGCGNNTIGGTSAGAGNVIANNTDDGVIIWAYFSGNTIRENEIFGNQGDAIGLGVPASAPVLLSTAGGQLEGWLDVGVAGLTLTLDFFASPAYNADGSGEAQDYLGSINVTSNAQGEAVFSVPFTPPAGLPIITATATDFLGNTTQLSALRVGELNQPPAGIRFVSGGPMVFSAAAGDAIALEDPDAGPFDPTWSLSLSAAAGTLTLGTTRGLSGSGDGTSSLSYSGPLSTLNAALSRMALRVPAGFLGDVTLSVNGQSQARRALVAQVPITVATANLVFTVTTTADWTSGPDPTPAPGSLRQAILDFERGARRDEHHRLRYPRYWRADHRPRHAPARHHHVARDRRNVSTRLRRHAAHPDRVGFLGRQRLDRRQRGSHAPRSDGGRRRHERRRAAGRVDRVRYAGAIKFGERLRYLRDRRGGRRATARDALAKGARVASPAARFAGRRARGKRWRQLEWRCRRHRRARRDRHLLPPRGGPARYGRLYPHDDPDIGVSTG